MPPYPGRRRYGIDAVHAGDATERQNRAVAVQVPVFAPALVVPPHISQFCSITLPFDDYNHGPSAAQGWSAAYTSGDAKG